MADRYNKDKYKFKWTKELIFLICGIVVLIVVTVVLSLPTKVENFLNKWPNASLSKETVFEEVDENKLVNLINDGGYVFVYYATPDEEEASTNMSLIETKATTFDIENVYWLDSTSIYNATEEDKELREYKEDILNREEALKGVDLDNTLSFWVFKDGALVTDYADYKDSNETNSFEQVVNKAFGDAYKGSLN